jgi:uroporphyrin-III C-methyltransferase/precorrin-2 dehydrogenase/sirohydrochlorin ferrochelatase
MRHFPIFIELTAKRIVVSGAGECAVAKLRLLLKTQADIFIFGTNPASQIVQWADDQKVTYVSREIRADDVKDAVLLYAANEDHAQDAVAAAFGRAAGALVNIVDNLDHSAFITPAIVDRSPLTIAIGTEGAAPVLARKIKQQLEETLPTSLGTLARIGQGFRDRASVLPMGRKRRAFWSEFYFNKGPNALATGGKSAVLRLLNMLLETAQNTPTTVGHVHFMGTGNGDPELLTLKARNILHEADVIIHDASVPQSILELVRREAILHPLRHTAGFNHLDEVVNAHAEKGEQIVRLIKGDLSQSKGMVGEIAHLAHSQVPYEVVKGIPIDTPLHAVGRQTLPQKISHAGIYAKQPKHIQHNEMVGS